ncbi:MAG: zinc-binding dehydrogenase [Phycisphaeraceae bacterium]
MKTRSAVLVELNAPLEIVDLEIPALQPGQVLVEVAHSGVCHTQLLEARGHRGEDRFLPHCLGHEGAGIVREVSEGITKVKPGDNVILSWIKGSGMDVPGTVYGWNSRKVNAGGLTTFSDLTIASENRLTRLPQGVPMQLAALLGCAIPTGVGAVVNTAHPREGQSIAIFGCGGVGLCAVAGAVVAGCDPVIAIDLRADKLAVAKELGATHVIDASSSDLFVAIKDICKQGLDFAIEATGQPSVMAQALAAVRPRGGTTVIIGNARHGQRIELDPQQLNQGKRLLGTWGGDSDPDRDYPRFADWLRTGRLNLEPLMQSTEASNGYGLEDVNAALADLECGRTIRPIMDMRGAVSFQPSALSLETETTKLMAGS